MDQYIVQAGDTLGSIAAKYGISPDALMQANGLTEAAILNIGQSLSIPAPEAGADRAFVQNHPGFRIGQRSRGHNL